jgi:endonuclease/exonuclease/phosphatase family metal-dependent hydrolase
MAIKAFAGDEVLTVMTYNLRFASDTPPNEWASRRPLLRDVIKRISPDVLGTQEGLYPQLRDINADLPGYEWIGLGRDGGSRGEFMAVFYKRERLEPVAFDHFWLSDTPQKISSASWGNRFNRMVTWVRFRDRSTGDEFYFWNTHFDHEVQLARENSAKLVRQRVAELHSSLPVILAGDFNAPAGHNSAYTLLTEDGFFSDAWSLAERRGGEELGTFNDFGKSPRPGERIDWILTRPKLNVLSVEIVGDHQGERYPSDHYPVVARLRLSSPAHAADPR